MCMAKKTLTRDSEFIVGEEKILNYILGLLCLALFAYGFMDAFNRHFKNIDYQSFVLALALIPAYLFFKKARSKRIYIRINKMGIYQEGQLVTDWSKLLNANITQKEKKNFFSIQDNFLLIVEYRKDAGKEIFRRKIPLTNTQNKSEEEVLEAVNYFWKVYRNNAGMRN